ncbi:hypothetical protein [Arthrobacter sedimenti]|uniref:hypothetical protein n=1 Tax=Arthrobacter sedimenti TaxID=2694931 RepID=UPI000B35AEED|nr:hypothetical protein [Arthrobacter sedimenti]OUM39762.1 hypothetical protein B8W73_15030 [Arthrobacter agilis]
MKPSAWAVTGVLVGLALVADWFFGLDGRHAVALVGAALAAGITNGLLEAVDVPRHTLPALPEPVRGLGDVQALEFSLSSTEPGTRAVLEVHAIATSVAAARPDAPRSDALDTFLARAAPSALTHREIRAFLDELERMILTPPGTRPSSATARSHTAAAAADPAGHTRAPAAVSARQETHDRP